MPGNPVMPQMALRWVRGNIAGFGGDPDNVTQFASTGDPDPQDSPSWPAYSSITDEHMLLARALSTGSGLRAQKCDFWFGLYL